MVTASIFRTTNTYLVYAEDNLWASAGIPVGTTYVDRVTSFNATTENNPIITQGIGEGPNAKKIINGGFDVTGDLSFELTDPSFLQYMFLGLKTGTGGVADPYIITEANNLGFRGTEVNTITLEAGKKSDSDDITSYDGVFFETTSITGTQGENNPIRCSGTWVARNAIPKGGVGLTYTPPTNRAFVWIDSKVEISTATVAECSSFAINVTLEYSKRKELNNRFLLQPVLLRRRYSIALTLRMRIGAATANIDGTEMRTLVNTGSTAYPRTAQPSTAAENVTDTLKITLQEGLVAGDRVVQFAFSSVYFHNWSEPIVLDNGDIEVSVTAIPITGASSIPVTWWTIV